MSAGEREEDPRSDARERALSLLYEAESKEEAPRQVLAALPVPRGATEELGAALARCVERAAFRVDSATIELAGLCARCGGKSPAD